MWLDQDDGKMQSFFTMYDHLLYMNFLGKFNNASNFPHFRFYIVIYVHENSSYMLIPIDWLCNFLQITKLFFQQKGNCKLLGKPKLDFKSCPSAFTQIMFKSLHPAMQFSFYQLYFP